MSPVDRYAASLASQVRETPLLRAPLRLSELELQAHWFAGDFGREFQATSGEAVRIVQFGVWNREAGPDFADAAVSFAGGKPVAGSIEFDIDVRDWERHGHATNPDYEPVVVHVFTQTGSSDFFTRTAAHRNVPQVLIDPSRIEGFEVPNPLPEAKLGRCSGPLSRLPDEKVNEVLLAAARYRLNRKAAALARMRELHGADEALYQALATTLGYKNNKLPFTLLAQRLPLHLLAKSKDDIEALLFGISGFLPAKELTDYDETTRSYLRGIWEKWWPRRAESARLIVTPQLWRLSGQRPANHPQRRIAALAQIVRHWGKVKALSASVEPRRAQEFFSTLSDPYWDYHYTLSSKSSRTPMALVGETRVLEMLLNVFLPQAIVDDERHWDIYRKLSAPLTNRRVETAAIRLFGESKRRPELLGSAAIQQGLLQIYEDFCLQDASDCSQCRFPQQLAKW